jgi:hypothetical protein
MTASAVQRAGGFSTRRFVISAGAERQFDCDAVQLLVTELDNAAEMQLQLNGGDEGRAWKGFEATGRILQVKARNTAADPITVEFLLVSPGLVVRDRRLNQVGDLGVVTTFDVFQPIAGGGTITIPGMSVRQVALADPDRILAILTNPPGQFREIYVSGSAVNTPQPVLANPGFELGALTGWTVVSGSWTIADAATTPQSDPRTGAFYARINANPTGQTLRQQFDLVSVVGFTTAQIDAGNLVANATGWVLGEDGVNDGGRLEFEFLDAGLGSLGTVATANTITAAGVYQQVTLQAAVPALTRHLRLHVIAVTNSGGSTLACWDDLTLAIDGAGASADELAALIPPSDHIALPTAGALYAFNPHPTAQDLLVGEIRRS